MSDSVVYIQQQYNVRRRKHNTFLHYLYTPEQKLIEYVIKLSDASNFF